MQSISWYVNRLKTMSAEEIIWRLSSLGKGLFEQGRVATGFIAKPVFAASLNEQSAFQPGFRVCDVALGSWQEPLHDRQQSWKAQLIEKADKVVDHRLSFFDLKNQFLGDPINWHRDHSAGIDAPVEHILSVDYRDFNRNGDCKLVWEPNRHHQLVVLGRAYRVTGERRYAQAVVSQLEAWLAQNPYGKGMNWRSPLELGIRLINWVWAIDLILDSGLFAGEFKTRLLHSVYLHCRDVAGKYSQGTSANNHLVGEAAGVFVAANYFDLFADAEKWSEQSFEILQREIQSQTYRDGCTREQALGYQFFVIQFYLIAALVGKKRGKDFNKAYWETFKCLLMFVARMAEGGGNLPMFGDRDDGYVLDLGDVVHDVNALMSVASRLFDEPLFLSMSTQSSETAFWLLNEEQNLAAKSDEIRYAEREITSQSFAQAGYYLLQYGCTAKQNKISVLFDCAELGYTNIAAHGHADALSVVVRINDADLFVDTGTYDYFSYPAWRNFFRTTRAHNTVEIDGENQSEMQGPFMWSRHAQANCLAWNPRPDGGAIIGEHDGYTRLNDPVLHRRQIDLCGEQRSLMISDSLRAQSDHSVALYFHLSEAAQLEKIENNLCYIHLPHGKVTLELDASLKVNALRGDTEQNNGEPTLGWLSRGYHQKTAITTIVAKGSFSGEREFKSRLSW